MKGTQLFLATLFLFCVAFALTHVTASTSAVGYGESNDEIRANRLRNLADAIAELKAEADQEREEERMQTQRMLVQVSHETQATTQSATQTQTQTQAATSSLSASSNAVTATSQARDEDEKEDEKEEEKPKKNESSDEDEDEDEKKKKAEKAAPVSKYPKKVGNKGKYGKKGKKPSKSQGTRRKDLVALYRFESEKNPGKGLGGPGRNLKVFGKGMKVVKGKKVAAHGRGALFVAARPTTVPAQVDATNPFQNSWLARDAKGTPIAGLPKGDESFTIAAWYKVTASKPGRYGVVSIGQLQPNQANIVRVSSNGQASASFKTGQVLTSNNTADLKQQWHHAAVTWDKESKTQKIYVDGKLAGSRQLDQAPAIPANGAFFVGLTANAPDSEQFTGFLDDVAIFRVALKSKDVRRIQKGRFDKYLDLFSLRSCTSRVGHRQHGAGFVMGSAEDQISLSDTPEGKYGFNAKSAFECAKKCSQTTDCRQSVFYANAPAVGGAPAPAAAAPGQPAPAAAAAAKPVQHSGSCYLMNKKYPTYEADKSATSTVCRKPKRYLRRRSTKLKGSPVYEKAAAKRRADRKAKRDAKKKEREAKKAKAAKYGKANNNNNNGNNNNNNKYGNKAGKNKYGKNANKNKYGKNAKNKNKYSQPPGAGAANVPTDLKSKYEAKIRKLQVALAAKDQALKQLQSQSNHRVLLKTRKAEQVIAKLTRRLAKASRKLNSKEDDAATLALAAKIKLEADRKAEEILKAARKKSVHVKKEAKKIAVRRLKKKAAKRQAKVKKTLKRVSKLKKKAKKLAKKLAKNDAKKSEKLARAKEAKRAAKKAAKKQAMTAAQKALRAAKKKAAKKANKAAKKAAKKAGQAAKAKIAAALKRAKKADGSKVKPKVKVNKAANGGMF